MSKKEVAIVITILLLMFGGIAGLVWYASTHKKPEAPLPQQGNMKLDLTATDEDLKNENPLANRQVYFAGIEDATINRESKVALENLPENEDFLMKYIIYNADTNEQIFETDLIPSGKKVYWVPGEKLTEGEYNIAFVEMPYAPGENGEYTPLTQGKNVIKLVIK